MRQAFRRYAFPMIIIAAVLAAALPLNSFAVSVESVSLTSDLAYNILGASRGTYYRIMNSNGTATGVSSTLYTDSYIQYGDISLPVVSRNISFPASSGSSGSTSTYELLLPLFAFDVTSLDFDFFFGSVTATGSSLNAFTLKNIYATSNGVRLFEIPFKKYEPGYTYTNSVYDSSYPVQRYTAFYSSSSFDDINYLSLIFEYRRPSSSLPDHYFIFALSPLSSLSTPSSNVASLINSMSILAALIDSVITNESSSDATIVSYLSQILAAIQAGAGSGSGGSGSDPGTGEGEDILQEGAIKQEQLEHLGDALSNVPKPSIENITQSFDPADTLISADPGMIQNALSIVYSWDKFLILLGLFIAVGTISYIIFGKKS